MSRVVARFLLKLQGRVEAGLAITASAAIGVMMLLTTVDVVARKVFSRPIAGSFEVISLLFVGVVFLGLAYAQSRREHITMDMLHDRLPVWGQSLTRGLVLVLSLGIFALITWRSSVAAVSAWEMGETLLGRLPVVTWPAKASVAVGAGFLSLRLLVQIGELVVGRRYKNGQAVEDAKTWTH